MTTKRSDNSLQKFIPCDKIETIGNYVVKIIEIWDVVPSPDFILTTHFDAGAVAE